LLHCAQSERVRQADNERLASELSKVETELRKIKDTRDARMEEMEQHLRMYHQINHVFVGQQDTLVGYQVSVLS
jgi:hypothetical protein